MDAVAHVVPHAGHCPMLGDGDGDGDGAGIGAGHLAGHVERWLFDS